MYGVATIWCGQTSIHLTRTTVTWKNVKNWVRGLEKHSLFGHWPNRLFFAVYNLVYDVDVKETNARIEKYKAEHQDIIASKVNKKVIKICLYDNTRIDTPCSTRMKSCIACAAPTLSRSTKSSLKCARCARTCWRTCRTAALARRNCSCWQTSKATRPCKRLTACRGNSRWPTTTPTSPRHLSRTPERASSECEILSCGLVFDTFWQLHAARTVRDGHRVSTAEASHGLSNACQLQSTQRQAREVRPTVYSVVLPVLTLVSDREKAKRQVRAGGYKDDVHRSRLLTEAFDGLFVPTDTTWQADTRTTTIISCT